MADDWEAADPLPESGPMHDASLHLLSCDDDRNAIEIEIERTSKWGARVIFFSWYFVLLLALVLQFVDTKIQWDAINICSQGTGSLRDFDWTSSMCYHHFHVQSPMDPSRTERVVQWQGDEIDSVLQNLLNRFTHFLFVLPRPALPNRTFTGDLDYTLDFVLVVSNSTQEPILRHIPTRMRCMSGDSSCEVLVMQTGVTMLANNSILELSIIDPPPEVFYVAGNSSVGIVYQQAGYTIASIVERYVFMAITCATLFRFVWHRGYSREMYEQNWVIILNLAFLLYLNPIYLACVYTNPEPSVLEFVEFRWPNYFFIFIVAFMYSLVISSYPWPGHTAHQHPPLLAKLAAPVFVVTMITLDIVAAGQQHWEWQMEHCPNFNCSPVSLAMVIMYVVALFVCFVFTRLVGKNLGMKPYLSSRPQQLAYRLFIFLFTFAVLYAIITAIMIYFTMRDVSSLVTFQSSQQIGVIAVAFTFVQIISYAYTTTNRTKRAPLHPANTQWREVYWPVEWFEWIARHGGSAYMFFNEAERKKFHRIQKEFHDTPAAVDGSSIVHDEFSGLGKHFYKAAGVLESLENRVVRAAYTFNADSRVHRGFPCLETAIDCFNVSWEVYGLAQPDTPSLSQCYSPQQSMEISMSSMADTHIPGPMMSGASDYVKYKSPPVKPAKPRHEDSVSMNDGGLQPVDSTANMSSPTNKKAKLPPPVNVEQYGYRIVDLFEEVDIQVLFCVLNMGVQRSERQPRLVVAFRGTDNMNNVTTDLKFFKKRWHAMDDEFNVLNVLRRPAIQEGFRDAWEAMSGRVIHVINEVMMQNPEYELHVTGHSLGGALAVLCAYVAQKELTHHMHPNPKPQVYTFGMPRVGNQSFKIAYDRAVPATYRIVNESDVTANINLLTICGHTHVGLEVSIDRHGNFLCDPMFIEQVFRPTKGKGSSLTNHLMTAYAESLNMITQIGLGICPNRCLAPRTDIDYTPPVAAEASFSPSPSEVRSPTTKVGSTQPGSSSASSSVPSPPLGQSPS